MDQLPDHGALDGAGEPAADLPISIEAEIDPRINYAMQQNDVPVVRRLRLENRGPDRMEDLRVRVWVEGEVSEVWERRLAGIEAGGSQTFEPVDVPLRAAVLVRQSEREKACLRAEVRQGERVVGRRAWPVEVLAYNEWAGTGSLPEMLAAFVMPNHPAVSELLARARPHLERLTGSAAFNGYQSRRPEQAAAMAEAIYQALAELELGYITPPASYERQGQKVRPPEVILEHRLATCLDLALLMAACLEQAGLHPLLILVEGHAFAGVWTQAESFAEAAVEEPLRLRKRVELGEILVVETTVLTARPAPGFAEARRLGWQHLQDPDHFTCAIDVHSARALSIRPLPMRLAAEAAQALPEPAAPPVDAAARSAAAESSAVPPAAPPAGPQAGAEEPATPAARLERWKRKLLDLSLHNRVINYRPSRKSLPLMCPDPGRLEDALAEGHTFELLPRPPLAEQGQARDLNLHAQRTGEDALAVFLGKELASRRLYGDLPERELAGRLLEIYRTARATLEDSGANVLYLAMGFLAWYESPSSDQRRLAPILLLPVELERRSARSAFRLRLAEDEPHINVTLLEKLRSEFGLEVQGLDELTSDEAGLDVPLILRRFRALVKDIARWEVVEEVHLGLFSFTKFLMWRDLQVRADSLLRSRVVRYLVERPTEAFDGGAEPFPQPVELDEKHPPAETFCPLDADSSQLAAVYAAQQGRSYVLEGPPGTGKSQTITNLIAHCLGHGRRVLFVAEKLAALDVVQRRLSQAGLGPFCLELHSHKASKRQVLAQLEEALEAAGAPEPQEWARHAQALAERRRELNRLVEALHRPRPLGETVFQVTSRLIGLRDAPRLPLRVNEPLNLRAEHLARFRAQAERLAAAARTVGDLGGHPLRAIRRPDFAMALPEAVEDLAGRGERAARAAAGQAAELAGLLGVPEEALSSREGLAWLAELGELLGEPPRPAARLLQEPDWPALRQALGSLIERGRARDQQRRTLLQRYRAKVLQQDLPSLSTRLAQARTRWLLPRWLGCRAVRRQLQPFALAGTLPENNQLAQDLQELMQVAGETAALQDPAGHGAGYFGLAWNGGEADWAQLAAVLDWADRFRRHLAQAPPAQPEHAAAAARQAMSLATEQRDRCAPEGPIGRVLAAFAQAWGKLKELLGQLERLLQADPAAAWGAAEAPEYLEAVCRTLEGWRQRRNDLDDWCHWQRQVAETRKMGLGALAAACEAGRLAPEQFRPALDHTLYQQWLQAVTAGEEVLSRFSSTDHQHAIEIFRDLDRRHLALSAQLLRARLAREVPRQDGQAVAASEMGILQRQLKLQRRHLPVRKLIQKLPHLLPRLKPCLLMSPLSAAQYLDLDFPPFDLVIFDEASQIPVWDAVGALARGRQAIVVGDSKQLPPTNFFMKLSEEEPQDEEDVEDLESVLDECSASGLPALRLLWHYRSRHESLIAFSNHHYYENRLYTFPSPQAATDRLGVSLHYLAEGVYDRGRSRTNRAEAQAVVAEVVRRLRQPGGGEPKSLGVVTFSVAQQGLIEDLLDEARREHPEIEPYFGSEVQEPLFVKNLESVQGDERAVILFSVCYGPDSSGRITMGFGPLLREGGQRRLNVAITRAREQVMVFASLRAEQIDLSRTQAQGVAHLKTFLDYAERGPRALAEAVTLPQGADFESPFERQVHDALAEHGWRVDLQVGCSGYRIDLAVRDPRRPGAYLLGIECDGAFYHSARTARDRDRLRQAVLEHLGWRLHRVWSRDWWVNPKRELEKIEAALRQIQRERPAQGDETSVGEPDAPGSPGTPGSEERGRASEALTAPADGEREANGAAPGRIAEAGRFAGPAKVEVPAPAAPSPATTAPSTPVMPVAERPTPAASRPAPDPDGPRPYQPFTVTRPLGSREQFYQLGQTARLQQALGKVLRQEAPLSPDLAARRLMALWQIDRRTSRVTQRVREIIARLAAAGEVREVEGFLWRADQSPESYRGFRVPAADPATLRAIEDIPPQELANACRYVLTRQISLPADDLCREAARLLGFGSYTSRLQPHLQAGLALLHRRGGCTLAEGRAALPR